MVEIRVDTSQMIRFAQDLGIADNVMIKQIKDVVERGLRIGRDVAIAKAPEFHGGLKAGITSYGPFLVETPQAVEVMGRVEPANTDYALVQEYGRNPGSSMPPIDKIKEWLAEKIAMGSFNIDGWMEDKPKAKAAHWDGILTTIAIHVARSIMWNGTPGWRYMEQGQVAAAHVMEVQMERLADTYANIVEYGSR